MVLAIVGLANIYPTWMAAISAIALGAALMLHGAAVAARYYSLLDETGSRTRRPRHRNSAEGSAPRLSAARRESCLASWLCSTSHP